MFPYFGVYFMDPICCSDIISPTGYLSDMELHHEITLLQA
jgi:hypothetical protein